VKQWGCLLVLLAGFAHATPPDNRPPDNRPPDRGSKPGPVVATTSPSSATSSSTSSSTSDSTSSATSGIGDVTATTGPSSAVVGDVGSTSVSNQLDVNLSNPNKLKIKNVPSMVAPDIYPTVSCFRGGSGSAAGAGWGFSLGGGKIDEDCVEREEIRLAHAMGLQARALYRWCRLPNNVEAFGSVIECMQFDPTVDVSDHVMEDTVSPTEFAVISDRVDPIAQQAQQVDDRLARLEAQLVRAERRAEQERREREQWKKDLSQKYLDGE